METQDIKARVVNESSEAFITVKDARKLVGVSLRAMWRWLENYDLPHKYCTETRERVIEYQWLMDWVNGETHPSGREVKVRNPDHPWNRLTWASIYEEHDDQVEPEPTVTDSDVPAPVGEGVPALPAEVLDALLVLPEIRQKIEAAENLYTRSAMELDAERRKTRRWRRTEILLSLLLIIGALTGACLTLANSAGLM